MDRGERKQTETSNSQKVCLSRIDGFCSSLSFTLKASLFGTRRLKRRGAHTKGEPLTLQSAASSLTVTEWSYIYILFMLCIDLPILRNSKQPCELNSEAESLF